MWTGCKLRPAGEYVLFLVGLGGLGEGNPPIGRLLQCVHVPTGAFVWQFPTKEVLENTQTGGDPRPWVQAMEIYMKGPRDQDTDVLRSVAVGSTSKDETGFVRT